MRNQQEGVINKYYQEHVREYQDRMKRIRDLSLEAQLNVECDSNAKGAVKGSMTKNLREGKKAAARKRVRLCCGEETNFSSKEGSQAANRNSTSLILQHRLGKEERRNGRITV